MNLKKKAYQFLRYVKCILSASGKSLITKLNEEVASVLQGSVLALTMFLVYENDIKDNTENESYLNKFADDVKIQRIIIENSYLDLQNNLAKLRGSFQKSCLLFFYSTPRDPRGLQIATHNG